MLKKWYAKLLVLLAVGCAVAAAHPAAQAEAIPEETAQMQAESDTAVQGAEMVASGICGDNLTWSLDSAGTLTISGSGAMTDYSINNADSPRPGEIMLPLSAVWCLNPALPPSGDTHFINSKI